jgi:hypothetical protein
MSYLIIAEWDADFRPTKINQKDTEAEAQALVEKLQNELGHAGAFYVGHPGSTDTKYMTVDPNAKTVTLDTAQQRNDTLIPALAAYRYEVENGGITVSGVSVQTDRESRGNLTAARILAKEDPAYSTTWKTGGGFVTLDAATILTIAQTVHDHVQKAFNVEAAVTAEIEAGTLTSVEQVHARFDELMAAN